jgi:hypothetical protein
MMIDQILKSIEIAVEETLNPSSKDMRLLKEKLIGLLKISDTNTIINTDTISDTNINNIGSVKCNPTSFTSNIKRKPHSTVPDEYRCEALICDLEIGADNKLVPARCKRSMLPNSKFCKQHGSIDGTVNLQDSEYYGKEIVHNFKWEHLGTIHSPSYVFEKSYEILLKKYNAKNKVINNIDMDNHEYSPKKSTCKKEKPVKAKRTIANAFITYKSDNFASIKNNILANNSNISGRDLVVAITKEASERWKSISDEDKAAFKKKALANKTAVSKPVTLLIESDSDEEEIIIPNIEEMDDEESTLVYNPTLKVWVDTDNNLCYETKDNTVPPFGQLQRGKMTVFPRK